MIALLGVVVGFVVALSIGARLIALLADVALRLRPSVGTYASQRASPGVAVAGFRPLDLGPDTLTWPSQSGALRAWQDELWWPSERWTDDAFGPRRRAPSVAPVAAPSVAAPIAPAAPPKRRRKASDPAAGGQVSPGAITPEEVRGLIDEHGLAGAVQLLAERRGLTIEQVRQLLLKHR